MLQQGAVVQFHDPLVKEFTVNNIDLPRVDDVDHSLAAADIGVLLQNHQDYDVDAMSAVSRRFFDTRGVARPAYHVELL